MKQNGTLTEAMAVVVGVEVGVVAGWAPWAVALSPWLIVAVKFLVSQSTTEGPGRDLVLPRFMRLLPPPLYQGSGKAFLAQAGRPSARRKTRGKPNFRLTMRNPSYPRHNHPIELDLNLSISSSTRCDSRASPTTKGCLLM